MVRVALDLADTWHINHSGSAINVSRNTTVPLLNNLHDIRRVSLSLARCWPFHLCFPTERHNRLLMQLGNSMLIQMSAILMRTLLWIICPKQSSAQRLSVRGSLNKAQLAGVLRNVDSCRIVAVTEGTCNVNRSRSPTRSSSLSSSSSTSSLYFLLFRAGVRWSVSTFFGGCVAEGCR